MKLKLSQDLVLKLTIDKKIKEILHGKIIFEQNFSKSEYYVYDDHRETTTGFSVKVSKTKKYYVIQRRVSSIEEISNSFKMPEH